MRARSFVAVIAIPVIALLILGFFRDQPANLELVERASSLERQMLELRAGDDLQGQERLLEDWRSALAVPGAPAHLVEDLGRASEFLREFSTWADSDRRKYRESDRFVLTALERLDARDFEPALVDIRQASRLRRELVAPPHEQLLQCLEIEASILMRMPKMDARAVLDDARSQGLAVLGEHHPRRAVTLDLLSDQLSDRENKLTEAELNARESLALRLSSGPPGWTLIARSHRILGSIFVEKSQYDEGIRELREAVSIYREGRPVAEDELATTLARLGFALWQWEDIAEAEAVLTEAVELSKRLGLGNTEEGATTVNYLAIVHKTQGKYEQAIESYSEAIAILERLHPDGHEYIGMTHYNIGRAAWAMGDYERAEEEMLKGIGIVQAIKGDLSLGLIADRTWLAVFYLEREQFKKAEDVLKQAVDAFERSKSDVSPMPLERIVYATGRSPYPILAISQLGQQKYLEAWSSMAQQRGTTLFELIGRVEGSAHDSPTEQKRRRLGNYIEWLEREKAIADHRGEPGGHDAAALQNARRDWSELLRDRAGLEETASRPRFDLQEIQKCLDPTTAIISWLEFREFRYACIVRDFGDPEWIALEGGSVDSLARAYRQQVANPGSVALGRETGSKVYRARVEPLVSHLSGVTQLFIVPWGQLTGLPLETLPIDEHEMVVDRWDVTYLPSESLLPWVRARSSEGRPRSFLGIGDPPFNEVHLEEMSSGRAADDEPTSSTRSFDVNDRVPSELAKLPRLSASGEEVREVANHFDEATVLTGVEATEKRLVELAYSAAMSGFSDILIGSHGFANSKFPEQSFVVLSQVDEPGAQDSGFPGRYLDGILTMGEVLREWRLDAELVTLSSCKSGLGVRAPGEGFVGLSHAFFVAGARSVLTSLWSVDDRPTRLLVEEFYRLYLAGESKAGALTKSKQWLRDFYLEAEDTYPYLDPYYWGGFTLLGDSR